jgi:hypothetical protein
LSRNLVARGGELAQLVIYERQQVAGGLAVAGRGGVEKLSHRGHAANITALAYILYVINRRHRWMVEHGFAEETKPSGGGPFLILREYIEPSAQKIRHVREEQQYAAEKEAQGEKSDDEKSRVK